MLMYTIIFVVGCFTLNRVAGKSLPTYIKACKASDPNLNECFMKNALDAIPVLLKGDPDFKLAQLSPFNLKEVELKPSNQLTLILKDLKLWGLDTIKITGAEVDLKNKHTSIKLYAPFIKIQSQYNIKGTLLVLPIEGEGPATLEFEKGDFELSYNYDLKERNGQNYIANLKPKVEFKIQHARYQLDNLFNGNKELGDNTNKLLNENWKDVLKDFGVAVSEIIGVVAKEILNDYFGVVPYNEIFLP